MCGQANLQELVSDQTPNLQRIPVSKIINKLKSRIDIAIMHIFDFVVLFFSVLHACLCTM